MARLGRPPGAPNRKTAYKWEVVMFDKDTNQMRGGKYTTIQKLKDNLGVDWSCDMVHKLHTGHKTDPSGRFGKDSFKAKYGHIKLTKINEAITI